MAEERFESSLDVENNSQNALAKINQMEPDDYLTAQRVVNELLYKRGVLDSSLRSEYDLYRFAQINFTAIDNYLHFQGLKLVLNPDWQLIYTDISDDESGYSPFAKTAFSGNQLILLCVLHKRLATRESSKFLGVDTDNSVLLSQSDIVTEMMPFMNSNQPDYRKKADAVAAINYFTNQLGLLRLLWQDRQFTDGTVANVYRVSPYISCKFGPDQIDKFIGWIKKVLSMDKSLSEKDDSSSSSDVEDVDDFLNLSLDNTTEVFHDE